MTTETSTTQINRLGVPPLTGHVGYAAWLAWG